MVQVGISRKSLIGHIVKSSATIVLVGFTLIGPAFAQKTNGADRYAPPVHIQPAAWSVLEDASVSPDLQSQRSGDSSASRSQQIASMSQYMRMQNEAVTAAKDAQVNAALSQLRQSREMGARQSKQLNTNTNTKVYAPTRVPSQRPKRVAQSPRPLQSAQPRPLQRTQIQPQPQSRQQPNEAVASRRVASSPSTQQSSQYRRGIGLQDRISNVISKRFKRSQPETVLQTPVAQQIPVEQPPRQRENQIQLVNHAMDEPALPALELPVLDDEPSPRQFERTAPPRAPQVEYRPKRSESDRVIVPSFIEAQNAGSELRLASSKGIIGSGVRQQPRVTSRSQAMDYPQQGQVSVFRGASAQTTPQQDEAARERLRQLESQLDRRQQGGNQNQLPTRPVENPNPPSLLDLNDESAAEEALRARSERDTESDSLQDDEMDTVDPDEDDSPVFDDRGCDELRDMLLNKSIRDISLDLSPPASPLRDEMGTLSRSWTDASGNVLATGAMVDLRRGYVILDSGARLPYARLSEADWAAIADNWLLPSVCSVGQRGSLVRNWAPQTVTWHASSLCHKPLYFENIQLERYGHSRGPFMQPIHSAFHFFGSILFLPYNSAINPPNECQYSLGFYRPGNCAPWLLDPIPFSREGIRRQALTSVGLAFIP